MSRVKGVCDRAKMLNIQIRHKKFKFKLALKTLMGPVISNWSFKILLGFIELIKDNLKNELIIKWKIILKSALK